MSTWKDLTPANRSTGIDFGYAVRCGANKAPTLEIAISPAHMRRLKWQNGEALKLQIAGNQFRLVAMAAKTRDARRLRVNDCGRGYFFIPASGDVAEKFGNKRTTMTPLVLVEATSEHLVFELLHREAKP